VETLAIGVNTIEENEQVGNLKATSSSLNTHLSTHANLVLGAILYLPVELSNSSLPTN